MKNSMILALGALTVLVASATPARAASPLDFLVYCVGEKGDATTTAIKDDLASECNVKRGTNDYCSLIEGTPWDCATPEGTAAPQPPPPPDPAKPKYCAYQNASISIKAGLKLPAGWTAETAGAISFGVSADKTPKGACTPKARDPMPAEGNGGKYVTENGTLFAEVEYKVTGKLELTSPQGFGVTLEGEAKCGRGVTIDYYKEASVNLCPCKKKMMMNVTSGALEEVCEDPGPTPTPSPSPSPTPTATPNPTPFPTPNPTPNPTPFATPFPTPFATPFPTPTSRATPGHAR
jgi:hypothetical protein